MKLRDKLLFPLVKTVEGVFNAVNIAWYARNGYPQLHTLLGGSGPTHTGRSVDERTALNCSTVWACVRIISETEASLPLHLMKETDTGKFPAKDQPLYGVLHDEPNSEMSAMELRETVTAHAVTHGNGYARIVRRNGNGPTIGLWPMLPTQTQPDRDKSKNLVYIWKDGNASEKTLRGSAVNKDLPEVLHLRGLGFDGLRGYPVITMARQSIALAQIQEEYAAKYFAHGGRRPYLLKTPQKFKNDQEFQAFRERWEKGYGDPDAFHKAPILEGGLAYEELGWSLEDVQFLQSRQFSVPEICRWFRISPHMVGDLSRATFSNIEHLSIEFVQQTLMAWLVRWEQAIRRCCLTPDEKRDHFAKHNVAGLLRGDFQSRMAGYATMLQNAVLNPNEVRNLEDKNPYEGGDDYHIQLNMQTVGGEPTASQQGALVKLGSARKNIQ